MQSVASGLKAKDISLRGNKSFILRNFSFPIEKQKFSAY